MVRQANCKKPESAEEMLVCVLHDIDVATDEMTEVLADMDTKISFDDDPEAYKAMHSRADKLQLNLVKSHATFTAKLIHLPNRQIKLFPPVLSEE